LGEHGRGFFSQLTTRAIRRGAFASVPDLIAAIDAYLTATNTNPTLFTWTKRPPIKSWRRSSADA
jgi:hypothetical protein